MELLKFHAPTAIVLQLLFPFIVQNLLKMGKKKEKKKIEKKMGKRQMAKVNKASERYCSEQWIRSPLLTFSSAPPPPPQVWVSGPERT